MDPFLQEWLARQPAAGWSDLAGGGGEIRLPLRQPLVNAALEALVLPRVPALRRLSLAFHPQQRVDVVAATSAFSFLPALTIPLELDPIVSATPTPRISLDVLRGGIAGALTPLAGFFTSSLPPGISVSERRIEIDLATLAAGRDALHLLPLLRGARLETDAGVLWLTATVAVPARQ
jgi:hypothetical protein